MVLGLYEIPELPLFYFTSRGWFIILTQSTIFYRDCYASWCLFFGTAHHRDSFVIPFNLHGKFEALSLIPTIFAAALSRNNVKQCSTKSATRSTINTLKWQPITCWASSRWQKCRSSCQRSVGRRVCRRFRRCCGVSFFQFSLVHLQIGSDTPRRDGKFTDLSNSTPRLMDLLLSEEPLKVI